MKFIRLKAVLLDQLVGCLKPNSNHLISLQCLYEAQNSSQLYSFIIHFGPNSHIQKLSRMESVKHVKWELICGSLSDHILWEAGAHQGTPMHGPLFCGLWKLWGDVGHRACGGFSALIQLKWAFWKANPNVIVYIPKTHQWLPLPLGWTVVSLELMSLAYKVLSAPASLQVSPKTIEPYGFDGSFSDQIYLNPQVSFLFYFILFSPRTLFT